MTISETTTRPADIGGIDLSGFDIAHVIFEATGGVYGTPRDSQPLAGSEPTDLPDWYTNGGDGPVSDHFDFSQPPADRDALIKLLADPEVSHALLDLFSGEDQPNFSNGGPEGTAYIGPAIVVLIVLAAIYLSGGCEGKPAKPEPPPEPELKKWEDTHFTDPEATTETLVSPEEMMADLLGKAGIESINLDEIGITDIFGKLSDNMGRVAELVGALKDASQSGDHGAFGNAVGELMSLAGIDAAAFDQEAVPAADIDDGVFAAFGIAGGMDGAAYEKTLYDSYYAEATSELKIDASEWANLTVDTII